MISDHLYNFNAGGKEKAKEFEKLMKQPSTFIHVGNRIHALDYVSNEDNGIHIYTSKTYVESSMEYNKSNRLDEFDAKEARRLSEKSSVNELQWVLQEIKRKAESESSRSLVINKDLAGSVISELASRGFRLRPWGITGCLITW